MRVAGLLQGFIASEAFITTKGNRAVKNHILWGQVVRLSTIVHLSIPALEHASDMGKMRTMTAVGRYPVRR